MKIICYIISIFRFLRKYNTCKTLYFNFHYFPFKVAIKMPVFICRRTKLYLTRGRIVIDAPVSTGMFKFGLHAVGTQDMYYQRSVWDVSGTLIITGKADIGRGCKISIGRDGILKLGENFTITGGTTLICQKEITFGDNCLLSWDILIMDTDFHRVINDRGNAINPDKAICIGNHVWIGCRNTILKGVTIADNTIISANSLITKSFRKGNCVIGGHGRNADILKDGVNWQM